MGAARFPRSSQLRRSLARSLAANNYCPVSRGGRALRKLWTQTEVKQPTRGPFFESPGIFSDPNTNIQIKIERITARVLAKKSNHFVLLTDNYLRNY